jgi:hypothetical protein
VALIGTAQAALVSLGDGTVKDTSTNLIWLQDWNVNGLRPWSTQNAWAQGLTFAGSSDWALPSIDDYATLFGEVGDLAKVNAFTNVQSFTYWSGTEYAPNPDDAWNFNRSHGGRNFELKGRALFAVAVRPGDVAAPVPEPQTLALALLALGATMVMRRRRPR